MQANKKPCPYLAKGSCKFGKKCKFLHDAVKPEQKICKLFAQGRCRFGKSCKFIHESQGGQDASESNLIRRDEEQEMLEKLKQNQQQQQSQRKGSEQKNRKKSSQQYNQDEETKEEVQDVQGEVKKDSRRRFKDLTKTEEGQKTFEKNKQELFNGDFLKHMQSLERYWEKDIAQVQRKYQSTFKWVNRDIEKAKVFQIKHTPTIYQDELTTVNFDLYEQYLWLEVTILEDYPQSLPQMELLNVSIPSSFRKVFPKLIIYYYKQLNKSLMKTFKLMDNKLQEIVNQTQEIIEEQNKEEEVQRKKDEKRRKKSEESAKKWTQEEQTLLEEGIKLFRTVENKDEKWQKISEFVGKTVVECLERVQWCKRKAAESSSEEDDSEEESEDSDSCEHDGYYQENDSDIGDEEQKDGEEEKKDDSEKKDEFQFGVDFNVSISLLDITMTGISICRLGNCNIQAKCSLCKHPSLLKVRDMYSKNSEDYMVNNTLCVNCNHQAQLLLKREFVHPFQNPVIARIGSATWDVLDIQHINVEINCEECNQKITIKSYVQGENKRGQCHQCFQNYQFQYFGIKPEKQNIEEKIKQKQESSQSDQTVHKYKKKIGVFKVGQPLPNHGVCSHYKNSFRYFRFPCCGKAYPCDICHQNGESKDHELEMGKAMICGYCGAEQAVKNTCSKCQSILTKISKKGGHWNDGKGTRNKKTMNKGDKQKYAGQNKTISRKKQLQQNK